MAVNKSRDPGLYRYSTKEALNQHLGTVVRVRPTFLTGYTRDEALGASGGYPPGLIVFDSTEIPNAVPIKGGTSQIANISYVGYEGIGDNTAVLSILSFFFTQTKAIVGDLDTIMNMSDANIKSAKYLGSGGEYINDLTASVCISKVDGTDRQIEGHEIHVGNFDHRVTEDIPATLQAESDSTSVYFHCTTELNYGAAEEGFLDYASTNPFEFIFGIEYSTGIGDSRNMWSHRR